MKTDALLPLLFAILKVVITGCCWAARRGRAGADGCNRFAKKKRPGNPAACKVLRAL